MSLKVPYLPDADIEASASALLTQCSRATGTQVLPPVDLDDVLVHLGLRLDLDDLRAMLGIPDVLGALWIEDRQIYINQTLDPDEQPSALGRFRFTLAHEIGHWDLHRGLLLAQRLQDDLFQTSSGPSIVCRTSQQRERIELQADAFAGALLMPRSEVVDHWRRLVGPERLEVGQPCAWGRVVGAEALLRRGRVGVEPGAPRNDLIELALRPMAKVFEVSPQAMRIRLERLGCIIRDVGETVALFEAV